MIGATFKLGFEDGAVRRGIRGLGGLVGRVGGQIGIGMARQVGARMTDLLGRVVMAIPDALRDTMEWAGGLTDMSTQTGVAIEDLILLEEKLRLAGVQARDTSKIISTLGDSIYEATRMDSPDLARVEAFGLLNIMPEDLDNKSIMEVFDLITKRIEQLGPDAKQLETAMGDIFGAKIGYQLLRYIKDYDAINERAKKNVGELAEATAKSANDIDKFGDALGRFENFKRSLSTIALEEFFRIAGADSADNFFDSFNPEKLRPKIAELGEALKAMLDKITSDDFSLGGFVDSLGEKIGIGIGNGIKKSFGVGDGPVGLGSLFGIGGGPKAPSSDKAVQLQQEGNSLLEKIANKITPVGLFSK